MARAARPAGTGELLFYAAVVALAAAPLDVWAATSQTAALLRAGFWGVVYATFAILILLHEDELWPVLWRNALLLVLPVFALASSLWSLDPLRTTVAALQVLSVIMFGTLMGLRLPRDSIAATVLVALLPVALAAAAMAAVHPMGVDENGDAVGVFSHKNTLGNRSAVLALAALALLAAGRLRFLAVMGLALALGLLGVSGLRTAWVGSAAALPALMAARVVRLSLTGWTAAVALGGLAACLLGALLVSGLFDPVRTFFQALDRDPTMTGRTTLWEFAGSVPSSGVTQL